MVDEIDSDGNGEIDFDGAPRHTDPAVTRILSNQTTSCALSRPPQSS